MTLSSANELDQRDCQDGLMRGEDPTANRCKWAWPTKAPRRTQDRDEPKKMKMQQPETNWKQKNKLKLTNNGHFQTTFILKPFDLKPSQTSETFRQRYKV